MRLEAKRILSTPPLLISIERNDRASSISKISWLRKFFEYRDFNCERTRLEHPFLDERHRPTQAAPRIGEAVNDKPG